MRRGSLAIPAVLGQCALFTIALSGQGSRSASVAHTLSDLLVARHLDAVAAKDPDEPDRFIAALLHGGNQLLVVSAKSTDAARVGNKLAQHRYREVYRDLYAASVKESRILFHDLGQPTTAWSGTATNWIARGRDFVERARSAALEGLHESRRYVSSAADAPRRAALSGVCGMADVTE
jgi:hypothetical protein